MAPRLRNLAEQRTSVLFLERMKVVKLAGVEIISKCRAGQLPISPHDSLHSIQFFSARDLEGAVRGPHIGPVGGC